MAKKKPFKPTPEQAKFLNLVDLAAFTYALGLSALVILTIMAG